MPVDRNVSYPIFDITNPTNVLDMPDNINITFGNFIIKFRKANKDARI